MKVTQKHKYRRKYHPHLITNIYQQITLYIMWFVIPVVSL